MRISSVSIVRNESDIIESFIRYNLQFIDHMWVIDHNSADPTRAILRRLIREGLPLTLLLAFDSEHRQAQRLTALARKAAITDRADVIMPLDADEFILAKGGRAELEARLHETASRPVLLPWTTYAPTPDDDEQEADCLRRVVHRCQPDGEKGYFKVAVPAHLFLDTATSLAEGSHSIVRKDDTPIEHIRGTGLGIAHYPIRSAEQALGKILLGELSLRLKSERKSGEGRHWADLYVRTRHNLSLSKTDLLAIATSYARRGPHCVVRDPIDPIPYTGLRYPELMDTGVTRRIIAFTEQVIQARSQHNRLTGQYAFTPEHRATAKHLSGKF